MNLHKYTRALIRFLKEEKIYSTFLDGIKKKYHTNYPIKKMDDLVKSRESSISSDRCVSNILDMCFNWSGDKILTLEQFDELFIKAIKVDKDFNYSENE